MREVIKEGRNVEEAIERACQELGVERDAIDFEIIALPKRGFLGLRNTPAKVRVFVDEPEKPAPRPAPQPKTERPREERPVRPVQEPKPEAKPAPKPEQEPKREIPKPPRPEKREQKAPLPKQEPREADKKPVEPVREHVELTFVSADEVEGKARTAADYVKSVLAEMGVNANISVAYTESGIVLRLSGDGLGVIIGRRGETLDSLQYLSGLVANREEGDYIRVTIDSGNYREKRERTLEKLAQKLSASAIRYGRPSTLEPMNPYERRIIHATVSGIQGVSSSSIGEEPNRRVVITPEIMKSQNNRSPRGGKPGLRDSRPPRRDGERTDAPRGDRRPYAERTDAPRGEKRPFGDRPPRRDDRSRDSDRPRGPRPPQGETVKPTSTSVDREFMAELEKNPELMRPAHTEEKAVRPAPAPSRTQAPKEGDDLPLYGKIDI